MIMRFEISFLLVVSYVRGDAHAVTLTYAVTISPRYRVNDVRRGLNYSHVRRPRDNALFSLETLKRGYVLFFERARPGRHGFSVAPALGSAEIVNRTGRQREMELVADCVTMATLNSRRALD